MKTKPVNKLIIKILSTLLILFGLIYFHIYFGYWWNSPSLGNDIIAIEISEGGFFPPGVAVPKKSFTPESPEFHKIIRVIEKGWKYDPLVFLKIPSYTVKIIHADHSETKVDVFGNFMRIKLNGDVHVFRSLRDVSDIIEDEFKITDKESVSGH